MTSFEKESRPNKREREREREGKESPRLLRWQAWNSRLDPNRLASIGGASEANTNTRTWARPSLGPASRRGPLVDAQLDQLAGPYWWRAALSDGGVMSSRPPVWPSRKAARLSPWRLALGPSLALPRSCD